MRLTRKQCFECFQMPKSLLPMHTFSILKQLDSVYCWCLQPSLIFCQIDHCNSRHLLKHTHKHHTLASTRLAAISPTDPILLPCSPNDSSAAFISVRAAVCVSRPLPMASRSIIGALLLEYSK